MRIPFVKPLDRYVFAEFWKIFLVTALGFPIITIIIDLTDHLNTYLQRQLTPQAIALSYVYWVPQSMFMVLPAAVLFATVFSVSAFTRHSEITAAKASGTSFYRFIVPILFGALLATGLDLVISDVMPAANRAHNDLINEDKFRGQNQRYNFAFAGDSNMGRVYKIGTLNRLLGTIRSVQVERPGTGPDFPSYIIAASSGAWQNGHWTLRDGAMHIFTDSEPGYTVAFRTMRDNEFKAAARGDDVARPPARRDEVRGAVARHQGHGTLGHRRERVEGGAGAQDRDSRHLHHHRAVRGAPGHEQPARGRRLRHRHFPRHHGYVSHGRAGDQGDRGHGHHAPRPGRLAPERHLCGGRPRRSWPASAPDRDPLSAPSTRLGPPRRFQWSSVRASEFFRRVSRAVPEHVPQKCGAWTYFLRDIGRAADRSPPPTGPRRSAR